MPRRRARSLAGLVVLAALMSLAPLAAEAQLLDLREHARQLDHLDVAVGLETAVFVGDQPDEQRATSISPSPAVAVRLWRAVLEVALPVTVHRAKSALDGTARKARVGNVWAGLSYLPDCSCGLSRLTLGVGSPTARADGGLETRTLQLANAAHGAWDSHLWLPDLLPLALGYQTLLPLGRRQLARLTGGGDLIVSLPGRGRDTEVGMQWAGEASVGRRVRFGGRLGATYWPTLPGDDFQSSLGTFLRYTSREFTLGARFVMNLDGPEGFAFASGGVWGVQVSFIQTL